MADLQVPGWFDEDVYIAGKLAEGNTIRYEGVVWNEIMVEQALDQAGGAYQNWLQAGNHENVSPSKYFDVATYLTNKAAQLNAAGYNGKSDYTAQAVLDDFNKIGLSVWDHYTLYGQVEGINPSNAFDNDAFFEAKMQVLNSWNDGQGWEGKTDWTVPEVKAWFAANGINPIMNYLDNPEGAVMVTPVANPVTPEDVQIWQAPPINYTESELTKGDDILGPSTAPTEYIGTVEANSSNSTFNATDQITGGNENDILSITLNSAFSSGMKGDGFVKGVKTVDIENAGTSARAFNTQGFTGVETWNLTNGVNLTKLAEAGVTVNLIDTKAAAASIGFAADAVNGESDALNLGLNNVGTADKATAITATGIESVDITATGTSNATLKTGGLEAAAIKGAGALDMVFADSTLASIDASAATGALTLDATAVTNPNQFTTLNLGGGDDVLKLASAQNQAAIDGASGNDEVIYSSSAAITIANTMSNVETLTVTGSGAATISGAKMNGVETIKLDADTGGVTISDFENPYTLLVNGKSGDTVTASGIESLTVQLGDGANGSDGKADTEWANAQLIADAATELTFNVKSDLSAGPTIGLTADKAASFTLNSESDQTLAFTSTKGLVNLSEATLASKGNVDMSGCDFGGKSDSIEINASNVDGTFKANIAAFTGDDDAAATATVTGSYKGANTVVIGADYQTIDYTGGLEVDEVTLAINNGAANNITLNTYTGNDIIKLDQTGTADADTTITIEGNLGADGGSLMDKAGSSAATLTGATVDISGLVNYNDGVILQGLGGTTASTLLGGAGNDTLKSSASAVTFGADMGTTTMTGGAGDDKFEITAGNSAATGITDKMYTAIITDFDMNGNDVIKFGSTAVTYVNKTGLTDDSIEINSVANLIQAALEGTTKIQANNVWGYYDGTNTTLIYSSTNDQIASIVQLQGVDAANLSAADFVNV